MTKPVSANSEAFETMERLRTFVGSSRRLSGVNALAGGVSALALDALSPMSDSPFHQGTPHSQSARSPGLLSLTSFADSIDDSPSATPIQRNIFNPLRHSYKTLWKLKSLFQPETDAIIPSEEKIDLISQCIEQLEKYAEEMKDHVNNMLKGKERIRTLSPGSDSEQIPIKMVVHELRTPLHNIIGNLDLFKEQLSNPQEYLTAITDSYDHLLRITSLILSNEDPLKPEEKDFSLEGLLESVLNKTRAYDSRVRLELRSDFREGLSLVGDPLKISQILLNLISNAMKYSPKPGTVVIEVRSKEIKESASILFSVRDEGPGMSPELQSRLFQAYSKGDQASDSNKESTGLGLALSQKYVGLMGGKIQVHSELNKGSTFFFVVDFKISTLKRSEIPKSPPPRLFTSNKKTFKEKNIRILAADDDESTQKMMKRFFDVMSKEQEGITFSIFSNGEEVVAEYQKNPHYDVLVLDMNMGDGLTGWETGIKIDNFAKQEDRIRPPVIICSGQTEEENNRLLESVKIDFAKKTRFLEKPIKKDLLIQKINQVVHQHRLKMA